MHACSHIYSTMIFLLFFFFNKYYLSENVHKLIDKTKVKSSKMYTCIFKKQISGPSISAKARISSQCVISADKARFDFFVSIKKNNFFANAFLQYAARSA